MLISLIFQVFKKIYYAEGIAAFYKGYFPTIAGVLPYAGVSFFTYDTLKRLHGGMYSGYIFSIKNTLKPSYLKNSTN